MIRKAAPARATNAHRGLDQPWEADREHIQHPVRCICESVGEHLIYDQHCPVHGWTAAGMSAMFAAPQIHTDDDGRHTDEQGREYRAVTVGGETTFVLTFEPHESAPATVPLALPPVPTFAVVTEALASWRAPAWATRSRIEDGGIEHTRTGLPCAALGDRDEHTDVTPTLTQSDAVDVDADGRVSVVREGMPVLTLASARYTLAQAEALARALLELVAAVQRQQ